MLFGVGEPLEWPEKVIHKGLLITFPAKIWLSAKKDTL